MAERHFLRILDLGVDELRGVLARAEELKNLQAAGRPSAAMAGRTLIMIFEKSSTRTRVSFEVGAQQLGGRAVFLSSADCQIGRGEPIKDTARVLSRYGDMLMIRTFGHDKLEELVRYAGVPVINGLSDAHHPCQILADLQTVQEKKGRLEGLKYAWLGDGNNVAHSWIEAAGRLGLHLVLACPEGYDPDAGILAESRALGGRIEVVRDPREASRDADVVMTDVWTSMGQESEKGARDATFHPYQLNAGLLGVAHADAMVLHCLPAHRGEEITDEVIEGAQSAVWDQAENRLHAQKALMEFLLTEWYGLRS